MSEQLILDAIEQAYNENDLRKAEVIATRHLRSEDLALEIRCQILMRRARIRLQGDRPDDALEDVQTTLSLQPSFNRLVEIKALLGDIYFARFMLAEFGFADRNNTELALQYYNEIIQRHPNSEHAGWVYYQRGRVHLTRGHIVEAINDFNTGLQKENRPPALHAFCYERLGFISLFENRDPAVATQHFDAAIHAYPSQENVSWLVQTHISRSRALREIGNYPAALDAASTALRSVDASAPDYRHTFTDAQLAVGEVLALIPNRESEAIEHLLLFLQNSKRPLGVDVTWSRVYETMGDLSLKLERYEQAIEAYQASLSFNVYHPWEVNIHYQIARCYYRMQAYERVISSIEKMQEVAEQENQIISDYRVFQVKANAHFALEHYEQAAQDYRTTLQLAPSGAANLDKVKTYLRFSEELALN